MSFLSRIPNARECFSLFGRDLNYCALRYYARIHRRFPVYPDDQPLENLPEFTHPKSSAADRRHIFAWGLCEHGGVGIAKQLKKRSWKAAPRYVHRPLRIKFGDVVKVADVACGFGFSLFSVESKGHPKVYGSGINTDSQLGYQSQRKDAPLELLLSAVPVPLPIEDGKKVGALAAGRAHSLVLVESEKGAGGEVLAFGNNSYGQCGRTVQPEEEYIGSRTVHRIESLGGCPVRAVSCGQDHSVFINTQGKVFSCGWGDDGQTGQGAPGKLGQPEQVRGDLERETIVKVASCADCNLAINVHGDLFGWGNSEYGQLFQPNTTQIYRPVHLANLKIGRVVDIAAGGSFCAALNDQGQVWVWGFGLIGLGPKVTQVSEPQMIPETLFGQSTLAWKKSKIVALEAGLFHLAAVSSDGDLFTWGRNKDGCLGLGHTRDQPFPLRVAIGARVQKVSCGVDHMVAICEPYF